MTYRITALNARNIAKHKPICGRCRGSILDDKCVPVEQRLFTTAQDFNNGAWFCAACDCNHPASLQMHERRGVQMCDQGAYDYDMHLKREAS